RCGACREGALCGVLQLCGVAGLSWTVDCGSPAHDTLDGGTERIQPVGARPGTRVVWGRARLGDGDDGLQPARYRPVERPLCAWAARARRVVLAPARAGSICKADGGPGGARGGRGDRD